MRRTAILEATKPPRRRLLLPGSRRQNVRPTRNGLGFMRKFGEYVFLEDSRYACQAKSARALPLGASARPDAAFFSSRCLRPPRASGVRALSTTSPRRHPFPTVGGSARGGSRGALPQRAR